MKRRRRAAPGDSPHTPRRAESPRRLKGYANLQDSCLPLVRGPGSLWGWEEHFEMTALQQLHCGTRPFGPESPSHSKLREGVELT